MSRGLGLFLTAQTTTRHESIWKHSTNSCPLQQYVGNHDDSEDECQIDLARKVPIACELEEQSIKSVLWFTKRSADQAEMAEQQPAMTVPADVGGRCVAHIEDENTVAQAASTRKSRQATTLQCVPTGQNRTTITSKIARQTG